MTSDSQIVRLQADNSALTSQNNTLIASLAQCNRTLRTIQSKLNALGQSLGTLFNNPSFQIPGTNLVQQVQSLSTAIGNLNKEQKRALYFNVGGPNKKSDKDEFPEHEKER